MVGMLAPARSVFVGIAADVVDDVQLWQARESRRRALLVICFVCALPLRCFLVAPTPTSVKVLIAVLVVASYAVVTAAAVRRGRRDLKDVASTLEEGRSPALIAPPAVRTRSSHGSNAPRRMLGNLEGDATPESSDGEDGLDKAEEPQTTPDIRACMEDVALLQDACDEAAREQGALHTDLAEMRNELATAEEERNRLTAKLEAVQAQMPEAKAEAAVVKESVDKAMLEKDQLVAELERAAAELKQAQTQTAEMARKQAELEGSMRHTKQECHDAEAGAAKALQELRAINVDRESLTSEQAEVRADLVRCAVEAKKIEEKLSNATVEREALRTDVAELCAAREASDAQIDKCAQDLATLRTEVETDKAGLLERMERLQSDLVNSAKELVQEEVAPMREDIGDLQRQVGEHEGIIQMLRMKRLSTDDGDSSCSRSESGYAGSDHGLSSCGVGSSGANTPTGSLRGRILGGRSFCSSAGSDSGASSTDTALRGRQILAGRSFTSSDAGDDTVSERSFSGIAPSPIADDQELMAYAQGLKPLVVTRKDLARILSRVPDDLLLGSTSVDKSTLELNELLTSIFRAVVVVANVKGHGDYLCFANGFSYGDEEYSLGRLKTKLMLRATPTFLAKAAKKPNVVPEDIQKKYEDSGLIISPKVGEGTAAAPLEVMNVKLTDIAARDLFLAELVGPYGDAIKAAALDPRCSSKSLRHRRHGLRHAKDALSLVLGNLKKDHAATSST